MDAFACYMLGTVLSTLALFAVLAIMPGGEG